MTKTVTLPLKEAAQAENRPLSNLIETAAFMRLREQQFVDEKEMNANFSDQDFLSRIKRGSCQARSWRGRFVD